MSHLPTLGSCSDLVPYPVSVHTHLGLGGLSGPGRRRVTTGFARGFLSSDDHLALLYRGPNLEVLNARTNERLAAWTFENLKTPSQVSSHPALSPGGSHVPTHEITCCTELVSPSSSIVNPNASSAGNPNASHLGGPHCPPNSARRAVVVGLANGLVCVLDLKSSRIIRAIQTGYRVASVAVISSMGGPMSNHRNMAEELMFFYGVLAVGTQEGHLYLIDLALDDDDTEESHVSTESHPASLHFIRSSSSGNIAEMRQSVMRRGQHLCLALNDQCFGSAKAFQHRSSPSGDSTYFPVEGVTICALKYVPQLSSLAVGFNYGAWQLWNIMNLNLEFSSNYGGQESLPVTEFTFQEPENDPRHYCYIWTVQSETDYDTLGEKMSVNSLASLNLYSLTYDHRDDGDQYGVLYSGLTAVANRFEHRLEGDPGRPQEEVLGSLALACSTLGFGSLSNQATAADLSDHDGIVSNLGLSLFLWETHVIGEDQPMFYFGLFDLNAWYQTQMPSRVRLEPQLQCPYFSICSLEDALGAARLLQLEGGPPKRPSDASDIASLINIGIDLSSISRYQSLSSAEQHFYPSSLAFDMTCLFERGFVYASNLGLQRKVLLELQSTGKEGLVEPQHLYKLCVISGLISDPTLDVDNVTPDGQRSLLLTVALENHLVSLLTGCIMHWKDGKYASSGCTLKSILVWSWDRVSSIKQLIDKVTQPLFDLSCIELNESTKKALMQNLQQLKHLTRVLEMLMRQGYYGAHTEQGMDELETKYEVTSLINQYLEVILWFFNAGLLPEVPSEPADADLDPELTESPYPVSLLVQMYRTKRAKMHDLLADVKFQDFLASTPALVIDGMCASLGDSLQAKFEREGGNGQYPPPNIYGLLSCYLINTGTASNINKHRIVQYLFLDIASILSGEKWSDLIHQLIKFPSAFSVPPSIIKLTQAFWLLDHEDFEEALKMLLDPLISNSDIADWQHRSILLAFLAQDQPKLALKYSRIRKPPQKELKDIQLHISILISNGMVHESFQFQRSKRNTTNAGSMLQYFFERAEALGKLDSVLQLKLMSVEEKALVTFLKDSSKTCSQEVLLMYYLQRSRYSEAMHLNEQLNSRPQGFSSTRQAIMDRYSKANLIPNSLLNRYGPGTSLSERLKLHVPELKKNPVPLSVEIKKNPLGEFNPVFHSSSIQEEMEKKRNELMGLGEKNGGGQQQPFTPFRPRHKRLTHGSGMFPIEEETNLKRKLPDIPTVCFPKDVSFQNETSMIFNASANNSSVLNESASHSHLQGSFLDSTPPPFKKSRRLTQLPELSPDGVRRMSRMSTAGLLSLLETPKIVKKTPRRSLAANGSSSALLSKSKAGASSSNTPAIATPQSILKVKRLMSAQEQTPPPEDAIAARVLDMSGANGEDEAWLTTPRTVAAISANSRSRESTPGKSLRFHVPKSLPKDILELDESLDSTKKTDEESSPAAANAHDVSGSEQEEAASEQDDSVRDVSVDDTENRYDQDSAGRSSTAVSNERIVTKHHDDDDLEEDEEVSFAPSTSRTLQNDDGDKASEAPESDDDLEVLETSNSRIEDEKNYQASKDSVETLPEQDEDDDDVESEKEKTSSENANTESKAEQDKISGKAPDNLSKKSIPELEFSDSEESTPEAADKMESESSDAQPEAEIEPKEASPAPRGTLSRIPDLVFSETEETPAKEVQNSAATFALVEDEARDKATTKTLTAKGTLAPIPSMEFSDSEDSDAIEKEVKKSPEEDRFVAATSEYKKSTVAVATTTSEVKLDEATAMKGPIAPIPPLEFSDSEDSAKETEDLKKTNAQNVEGADSTTSSSSYKVIETAAIRGAIAPIPELEFSDSEDLEIPEKKLGENRKEKKKEGNKSSDIEADAVPALGAKLDIPELKFSDSEGEEDRLPSSSPKQVALKTSSTSDIESSTTSIAYESKFAKTSAAIDNVEPEKEKSSKSMEDYSNESEVGTKITGDDDDDQIEVERPRSSIGQILLETAKAFTAKRVSRGKDELEMEAEECSTRNEAGTSSADSVSTKPVSRSNFEEVEDSAKDPSTPKRVSRSNKVMEQTEIVQNDAEESSKVSTRRISRSKAVENEVPKATPARRSSRSQSNASSTTIENEKEEINNKPPSRRTSRSSAVREIIEEKDVKTKRVSRSSKAEEVSESADSQEANSTTMLEPLDEVVPDEIEQTTANETEAKVESEPEKPAISGTRASRSSTTAQIEASETTVSTRRSSRSSKLEVTNNDVTDGKPEKKTRTSRSNTSTSILEEGVKTVATRRSSRSNSSVQAATEENVASSTKRTSRSSKSGSSPGQHSYADCSKRTPSPPRRVSRVAVETTDSSSDEKEASEDQQQPIVRLSPAELVKTMPRSSRRVSRSSKLEDVPENEVSTTTSTARQVAQQIESIAEEEEEKSSSRRRTSRSSISSVATQEKKESPKKKRTSRSSIASTTLEDASDEPAAKKRTTRSKSSVEKDAETPGRSAASKRSSRSSRVEDEQEAEAEQGMGKKRTSRSSRAATEEPKATPSASKKRTSRSSAAANQTDDKNVPPSSSKRTSRSRKTQPEVEEQHLAEVDDVAGGEEEYDPMADDSPPLTRAAAKGIGGRTRSRDSTDAKPKLVLKDPFTPAPKKRTSRRGGATSELETISEKGKEEEKKTKYKVAPIRPRTGRMPK